MGKEIEGYTQEDLRELRKEFPEEGMEGVDPRFVLNRLSRALVLFPQPCLTPLEVLKALKEGIEEEPGWSGETKERFLNFVYWPKEEYDAFAERELRQALLPSHGELAQTLFQAYLDQVEAYLHGNNRRDPLTGKDIPPDEGFMRSLEEEIGVTEISRKAFREEIYLKFSPYYYLRQGKAFEYRSHLPIPV